MYVSAESGNGGRRRIKRMRISSSEESSSEDESDSSSDDERASVRTSPERPTSNKKASGKNKGAWSSDEIKNLKKNFRFLENLDDSIIQKMSFKDFGVMGKKREQSSKAISEKLAQNYEHIKTFGEKVEAGEDFSAGKAHSARFLRGYVGSSQELWLQARRHFGLGGLDPISNYDTVSVGLNGFVSGKVWMEIHSPSSKHLTIRLLTSSSLKSGWGQRGGTEKEHEHKEFETIHELKMAVVALDGAIRKALPWNHSFAAVAIFMHSVEFGEKELNGKNNKLTFLADFIDEIISYNATAWDEERVYMGAQDIAGKWAASFLRVYGSTPSVAGSSAGGGDSNKKRDFKSEKKPLTPEERCPPGVCRNFQDGKCSQTGEKHFAHWDPEYILRHVCAKWLKDKKRYCFGGHSKANHK